MKVTLLWWFEAFWSRARRDFWRVALPFLAASFLLAIDAPLAMVLGRPEMAPWFMFAGLAFFGVGLSHVLRRWLFPYLDLKQVAEDAKTSTGSGLVFLGVCVILAVALHLMGALVKG